jgi:hypothetical protein
MTNASTPRHRERRDFTAWRPRNTGLIFHSVDDRLPRRPPPSPAPHPRRQACSPPARRRRYALIVEAHLRGPGPARWTAILFAFTPRHLRAETKHKHHYAQRSTPRPATGRSSDYSSRSAHGSSHNPPQLRHLDADGPSGFSKIGQLAAKTVSKP